MSIQVQGKGERGNWSEGGHHGPNQAIALFRTNPLVERGWPGSSRRVNPVLFVTSYPPKSLLVLVIIKFPISWNMSLVCMECSSGNKFVSVEACLWEPLTVRGYTFMGWHLMSNMCLRCADCISDKTTLLLVSLGKGSTYDPSIELWNLTLFAFGEVERLIQLL